MWSCFAVSSLRTYCPSVITTNENDLYTNPKTQLTLLLKPKRRRHDKKSQGRKRSQGQADPSWLYPILLPSIFPTLFSLYKAQNYEQDLQLRTAMVNLQSRTDKDLCEILDIKRYLYCTSRLPSPAILLMCCSVWSGLDIRL